MKVWPMKVARINCNKTYFFVFQNRHFQQGQDQDDMKTKNRSCSTENHGQDSYIPDNRLTPCDKFSHTNNQDKYISDNRLKNQKIY